MHLNQGVNKVIRTSRWSPHRIEIECDDAPGYVFEADRIVIGSANTRLPKDSVVDAEIDPRGAGLILRTSVDCWVRGVSSEQDREYKTRRKANKEAR